MLHFVYRAGVRALEDWSTELRHALVQHATVAAVLGQFTLGMRLKCDFQRSLLWHGHVFSLPCIGYAEALAVSEGKTIVVADTALHSAAPGIHFMQIVEANVRRRKMPRTATARACRGMRLPAM